MTETLDKKISQVQKLLAKAMSTTPEEAELLRQKAHELMTNYAIEQWEIEKAQRSASGGRTPIKSNIDFSWYWEVSNQETAHALYHVFIETARHTRIELAYLYVDYKEKTYPIVGMRSDIEYFKILFTDLFRQVTQTIDPTPLPGESMIEALARMKEAGLKWEVIYNRLVRAELQPDLGRWTKTVASKVNYAGKYTKFCDETDRVRMRVAPTVWKRSFLAGFSSALSRKLWQIREGTGENTGSRELALRDYRDEVREAMYEFYPDHKPKPVPETPEHNGATPKKSKRRAAKPKMENYSWTAEEAGINAGLNVSIISQGESSTKGMHIKGELDG